VLGREVMEGVLSRSVADPFIDVRDNLPPPPLAWCIEASCCCFFKILEVTELSTCSVGRW
jgi:hypothetical protein